MKFANKTHKTRVIINYQRCLLGPGNGYRLGLGPSKRKSSALITPGPSQAANDAGISAHQQAEQV